MKTKTSTTLNYPRASNPEEAEGAPSRRRRFRIWNRFGVTHGSMRQWVLFAAYLGLLAILYIAYQHDTTRTARRIDRVRKEIKDLRADYLSVKKDLMYKTKKSQISKHVEPLGLKPLSQPPQKIRVDQDEY